MSNCFETLDIKGCSGRLGSVGRKQGVINSQYRVRPAVLAPRMTLHTVGGSSDAESDPTFGAAKCGHTSKVRSGCMCSRMASPAPTNLKHAHIDGPNHNFIRVSLC